MLLTKENDYAIRILRALKDGEKHTVKEICKVEEIPEAFAYKIIRKLQKADMVDVGRGVTGGCRMKQELDQWTLYDVIAAVDDEPVIMPCLRTGCSRNQGDQCCGVHRELTQIQLVMIKELKARTLSQMF